jgi:hypothetical protein
MIKFFRKIRQNLLMENKTGKYFKYAIGEIFLVVIGILIALQINNWNENRRLQNEELNLLIEVKSNLVVTLNNFKKDTLFNTESIIQLRKIEHYIFQDLPYNTELDTAFGSIGHWGSPYPIATAYTTLKTKGLDIISNTTLRNKIVNMYEFELTVLKNDYDVGEWNILNSFNPFIYKHIRSKNSKQSARPNDFESLKLNHEFSNKLGKIISLREGGLKLYKTTMISIEELIKDLDKELNSRK